MSRTCAYSLWLCRNATDKSTSQEILSSTGTSTPSGGQRVVVRAWYWPVHKLAAHARILAHACTQARRHSHAHDHISACAMARPTDARALAFLHSRPRAIPAVTLLTCLPTRTHVRVPMPAVYAALELTMTDAADASWHVACQCAGAASSACCVGKCTGACNLQGGTRLLLWWTWEVT